MTMSDDLTVSAVAIADDGVRILAALNDVDAAALRGCVADDPACWDDIVLLWPRCVFDPENAELIEGLPIRAAELSVAAEVMNASIAWFAIDLVGRRLLTGGRHVHLRLRREPFDKDGPASETIVLPPWWELHQNVGPAALLDQREGPLEIPKPHRELLWGSRMTQFFARQMIAMIRGGESWIGKDWEGNPCGDYKWTKLIHRDWLMTPHPVLGGGIPRDLLHIGKDWIADLADGQRFRVYQDDSPVPISTDLSTYENAPLGRHEVILYFEACRETIDAGWRWLIDDPSRASDTDAEIKLAGVMDSFLAAWLQAPFEGDRPPADVIRCDRLRIPLVSGGEDHVIDCDCPICEMMASGLFGPGFTDFDGHQLELDDEFAFSLCATREEWEQQQQDWAEMDARVKENMQREAEQKAAAGDDEFESAWRNTLVSDEEIPGDSRGHLQLAFLVADLVGSLKEHDAGQADVDALNGAFRCYRECDFGDTGQAASALKQTLQRLSEQHEYLVGRCADLQSRIDERIRAANADDLGFPF